MASKQKSLSDNKILKEATDIVEYMYENVLLQFSDFADEKWNTERKIRNSANDILFYVAQAVGNNAQDTTEYDWSYARKNLLGLRTMYVFAGKQNFLVVEPSIVVRIDKLIESVDLEIAKAQKEVELKAKKLQEPWLERYRLWKEMQSDSPK
jgi:hypothetical protein